MSEPTRDQVVALAKLIKSFPAQTRHQTVEEWHYARARSILVAGYLPPKGDS